MVISLQILLLKVGIAADKLFAKTEVASTHLYSTGNIDADGDIATGNSIMTNAGGITCKTIYASENIESSSVKVGNDGISLSSDKVKFKRVEKNVTNNIFSLDSVDINHSSGIIFFNDETYGHAAVITFFIVGGNLSYSVLHKTTSFETNYALTLGGGGVLYLNSKTDVRS